MKNFQTNLCHRTYRPQVFYPFNLFRGWKSTFIDLATTAEPGKEKER